MMMFCLKLIGTLGLASGLVALIQAREVLKSTTLIVAWRWAGSAWLVWVLAWSSSVLTSVAPSELVDQLWYTTAVLTLCPFIAVLGARRPGIRVWTWFIVVPLVLVLEWPAMAAFGASLGREPLLVEAPAVTGFVFVLLMGTGNYCGTRMTTSAFLLAVASILLVLPMSSADLVGLPDREQGRLWATACLFAVSCHLMWMHQRRLTLESSLDQVWYDFRYSFGIVWAKRIQERVNATARKENWAARLETQGFVWASEQLDPERRMQTAGRIDHTLKWLLRRFVDPAWIDQRIKNRD